MSGSHLGQVGRETRNPPIRSKMMLPGVLFCGIIELVCVTNIQPWDLCFMCPLWESSIQCSESFMSCFFLKLRKVKSIQQNEAMETWRWWFPLATLSVGSAQRHRSGRSEWLSSWTGHLWSRKNWAVATAPWPLAPGYQENVISSGEEKRQWRNALCAPEALSMRDLFTEANVLAQERLLRGRWNDFTIFNRC